MKKKKKFKRHFRYNFGKTKGHPTYIFNESEDKYYYIGITHAKHTKGRKNIKLRKNPNSKDKRQSYVLSLPDNDKKKYFKKKPIKGWKFSLIDKMKVMKIMKKNNYNKKKRA